MDYGAKAARLSEHQNRKVSWSEHLERVKSEVARKVDDMELWERGQKIFHRKSSKNLYFLEDKPINSEKSTVAVLWSEKPKYFILAAFVICMLVIASLVSQMPSNRRSITRKSKFSSEKRKKSNTVKRKVDNVQALHLQSTQALSRPAHESTLSTMSETVRRLSASSKNSRRQSLSLKKKLQRGSNAVVLPSTDNAAPEPTEQDARHSVGSTMPTIASQGNFSSSTFKDYEKEEGEKQRQLWQQNQFPGLPQLTIGSDRSQDLSDASTHGSYSTVSASGAAPVVGLQPPIGLPFLGDRQEQKMQFNPLRITNDADSQRYNIGSTMYTEGMTESVSYPNTHLVGIAGNRFDPNQHSFSNNAFDNVSAHMQADNSLFSGTGVPQIFGAGRGNPTQLLQNALNPGPSPDTFLPGSRIVPTFDSVEIPFAETLPILNPQDPNRNEPATRRRRLPLLQRIMPARFANTDPKDVSAASAGPSISQETHLFKENNQNSTKEKFEMPRLRLTEGVHAVRNGLMEPKEPSTNETGGFFMREIQPSVLQGAEKKPPRESGDKVESSVIKGNQTKKNSSYGEIDSGGSDIKLGRSSGAQDREVLERSTIRQTSAETAPPEPPNHNHSNSPSTSSPSNVVKKKTNKETDVSKRGFSASGRSAVRANRYEAQPRRLRDIDLGYDSVALRGQHGEQRETLKKELLFEKNANEFPSLAFKSSLGHQNSGSKFLGSPASGVLARSPSLGVATRDSEIKVAIPAGRCAWCYFGQCAPYSVCRQCSICSAAYNKGSK